MIEQEGIKIEAKLVDSHPGIVLVETSGYVDQANCHLLQKTIDDCLANASYRLIFDFKNLVYMSSAGWGVLIGEIKRFRENGGDIKLSNMGPEIYEIYQMLEFYHIISEYPSVEDALKNFGGAPKGAAESAPLSPRESSNPASPQKTGTAAAAAAGKKPAAESDKPVRPAPAEDLPRRQPMPLNSPPVGGSVVVEKDINIDIDNLLLDEGISKATGQNADDNYVSFEPGKYHRSSDIAMMPIPDKIRAIVSVNPEFTPRKIRQTLREPEFGGVKVGYFKLRSLLKDLELDTKEKRFRYYRSA